MQDLSQLAPFREEAIRRGIPADDVDRWMRTARPGATLVEGPGERIAGQLGGRPHMPPHLPDPGLPFVASLDCAAVPPGWTDLDLPPDGTLLFFIRDELEDGYTDCRVIHVPAGAEVELRPAPATDIEPDEVEVLEESDFHLVTSLGLPSRSSDHNPLPYAEELGFVWWDLASKLTPADGPLQIGGVPWMEQRDPFDRVTDLHDERPEDWALLCQWKPDTEELDYGYINLLIRRSDLAERRFDRIEIETEMQG